MHTKQSKVLKYGLESNRSRKALNGMWCSSFFSRRDACLVDQWEILPDEITCLKKIGHGQFGEVHIAEMKLRDSSHKGKVCTKGHRKENLQRPNLTVAVKLLSGKFEM